MSVLALNSGSSSVKAAVYGRDGKCIKRFHLSGLPDVPKLDGVSFPLEDGVDPTDAFLDVIARDPMCAELDAIGHRIVHGGREFDAPATLDADTLKRLDALTPLAPQHQPANLAGVRACQATWPTALEIGVFDTAFHRTQPRLATLFALPLEYETRGFIRYGFHGLSYQFITEELRRQSALPERLIVAHLGSGCSMAAIKDGKSIATTMGFTALDGLPMGTRSGSIDPGLILHLIEQEGMEPSEVHALLYKASGLKGLSGTSGDMREITDSSAPEAKLARGYFIYHCLRKIGALTATLGGCDQVILTGGIGENDTDLEYAIRDGVACLGIDAVTRIDTNEERIIADACLHALSVQ